MIQSRNLYLTTLSHHSQTQNLLHRNPACKLKPKSHHKFDITLAMTTSTAEILQRTPAHLEVHVKS